MKKYQDKLPVILAIVLYILIYLIRLQQAEPAGRQGGWEMNLDLFPKWRAGLDERISHLLPSPQAQLLSGILLGLKKDLPYDLKLAFRDTSTLHMIVVSGQNLSILAALLLKLAGLLTRRVVILLTIMVMIGYVILTGGQIPVLRAALMAFLSLIASVFGRQSDGFWILIIVAALLLLVNPLWILDLSFQLSFLATFGVVVVAPILINFFKFIPPILRENLAVTLAAQAMVMPVISQNFHQFSLVGVPANLAVLWTIPYMMIGGIITLVLDSILPFLGQLMAWGLSIPLTYFIYMVKFFASLPFAWEYVGEQIWIVWVGYYLLLAGVLIMLSLKNDKKAVS